MKKTFPRCVAGVVALSLVAAAMGAEPGKPAYKNFRVAIYVTRDTVGAWSNPQALQAAYENMSRQVRFDKVYLEFATARNTLNEGSLDAIKKFFTDKGIQVSGATALNGGGNQSASSSGGSLSYASASDRDWVRSVAEVAARHFDEVILDDWFFTASKTAADIAAKGDRTWSQYRMAALDDAAENLLIKPAKAINPRMRLIIKFPNWYEHYQAMGYDLAVEPKLFDGIYTGVETRDPTYWERHLQGYESYGLMRYLENVKPGGNDGGWVDTLFTRYIDRYPEQIWDMAFAKPREITLWQWNDALRPITVGERPWQEQETSLNLQKVMASYPLGGGAASMPAGAAPEPAPGRGGRGGNNNGPITDARNGRVAGYALEQMDAILDKLGTPVGIAAYRPPHGLGEEYSTDFLGMCGLPIEMSPAYPVDTKSPVILLTESAKGDPKLVDEIKAILGAEKNVNITSGLLRALTGKGIEQISELEVTGQRVAVSEFMGRSGIPIPNSQVDPPILFPVIHYITNQTWGQVNGFDTHSPTDAFPLVISDAYDKGFLLVLALPDNIADLYRIPTPALDAIRTQLLGNFPIRLQSAPAQVGLFAYDNNAFVVQSFLPTATTVTVIAAGNPAGITDLTTHETLAPASGGGGQGGRGQGGRGRGGGGPPAARFTITLPPHSYRAFAPAAP